VPTLAVVIAPSLVKTFASNVHVIVSVSSSSPVALAVKLIVFVDTRAPAASVFGVDEAEAPAAAFVIVMQLARMTTTVMNARIIFSFVEILRACFSPRRSIFFLNERLRSSVGVNCT